jgi:hypothetical protein
MTAMLARIWEHSLAPLVHRYGEDVARIVHTCRRTNAAVTDRVQAAAVAGVAQLRNLLRNPRRRCTRGLRALQARLREIAAKGHHLLPLALAAGRALRRFRLWRSRSLVAEILIVQLAVTALIGVGAIAGLTWSSSVIIQNHLAHRVAQWSRELDELGAPLYLQDEAAAMVNVGRFLSQYPEIVRVSW